jgi:hypothetical protein
LDRKGKSRKSVSTALKNPYNATFWVEAGNSISETRILSADSGGCVYSVGLNETKDSISFGEFTYPPKVCLQDLNHDNIYDYAFLDKTELVVYNSSGELLFDEPFDLNADYGPIIGRVNDEIKIGVCSKKAEEIYLFNTKGVLHEGFPLYGNSEFAIVEDDGNTKLITGVPGNYLYIYTLE